MDAFSYVVVQFNSPDERARSSGQVRTACAQPQQAASRFLPSSSLFVRSARPLHQRPGSECFFVWAVNLPRFFSEL